MIDDDLEDLREDLLDNIEKIKARLLNLENRMEDVDGKDSGYNGID